MKIKTRLLCIYLLFIILLSGCKQNPILVKSLRVSGALKSFLYVDKERYGVYVSNGAKDSAVLNLDLNAFKFALSEIAKEQRAYYSFQVENNLYKDTSFFFIPGKVYATPHCPIRTYEFVRLSIRYPNYQRTIVGGLTSNPSTLFDGLKQRLPFKIYIPARTCIDVEMFLHHKLSGLKCHEPILLSKNEYEVLNHSDYYRNFYMYIGQGAFHLLLIFQVFYAFFQWQFARKWFSSVEGAAPHEYLYYIVYLLGMIGFFLGIYGYFIFPSISSQVWAYGISCSALIAYHYYFRFLYRFLKLERRYNPIFDRIHRFIEYFLAAVFLLNFLIISIYLWTGQLQAGFLWIIIIIETTSVLVASFTIALMLVLIRVASDLISRLVLVGLLLIITTTFLTTFAFILFLNGYPTIIDNTVPLQFGVIFETFFFTTALSFKFRESIINYQGTLHDVLGQIMIRIEKRIHQIMNQIKELTIKNTLADIITDIKDTRKRIKGDFEIFTDPNTLFENLYAVNKSILDNEKISFSFTPNDAAGKIALSTVMALELQLVFEEAIANVLKHANCTAISSSVSLEGKNKLVMTLSDNGKGFNGELPLTGWGVQLMKKRCKRIGGKLIVISNGIGTGTSVRVKINLR